MNMNDMFAGKFLKAADVKYDVILTILDVGYELIGSEKQRKPVVAFQGTDKKLVLNKTNAQAIASWYGEETSAWIGKPVTLFSALVDFQGKKSDGIRIKAKAEAGATPSPLTAEKGQELPF